MKIVECVPNFSEGKNQEIFDELISSVKNVNEAKLLSLEPDGDYNRVVVTLAGSDKGIVEAALNMSLKAASLIDMRTHKGAHPRMGAIDVVPFVPIRGITMEECAGLAKEYGRIISEELSVPVYLYEEAAAKPERRNLANVRKGEYEGLREKLADPVWAPDFGSNEFNPRLGAIITGARFFLLAYNVNIRSTDISISKEIAEMVRESGRNKKDENGNVIKIDGKPVKEPGLLKSVKGMGVSLEKYGITQVSMNLTNYNVTGIHTAFEKVKELANKFGAEVSGSELVGLVPLEAIINAGKYYAGEKNLAEEDLIKIAVEKLGLEDLYSINYKEKIIDYLI